MVKLLPELRRKDGGIGGLRMTVDSHGFPMRDDLDQHTRISRVVYDGEFFMRGNRMIKKWKEVESDGRIQTTQPKKQVVRP